MSLAYRYPEVLNIYRQRMLATSLIGIFRLGTVIVAFMGTLFYFPAYLYSFLYPTEIEDKREEAVPWWLPPAILFGSWMPALMTFFAWAPCVHQIHVRIPTLARKSREELMRWASNVPRNTTLSVSVIRLKPWPVVQYVTLEDFTRLRQSWKRLTNLEKSSAVSEKYLADNNSSLLARVVESVPRGIYGRFYVSSQIVDNSAAPGVWDKIWQQIPMEGTRPPRKVGGEQKMKESRPPTARIAPTARPKS